MPDVSLLPPSSVFWRRRLVAVPILVLLSVSYVFAAPLVLPLAALVDLVRPRRWAVSRCVLYLGLVLGCELVGVVASVAIWLMSLLNANPRRFLFEESFLLQRWWAGALYRGAERIFGYHTEVIGQEHLALGGPFLLFMRHTSTADTLLPVVVIGDGYGIHLRFVVKYELLWDPCLNIVGPRLINCFVRRDSDDSASEVARVRLLMRELGPREGVLIYPEGTRFTPEKRARILKRLEEKGGGALLEQARRYTEVLPPRLGGTLALLEEQPPVDVLFCAHSGLEGAGSLKDILAGALIGRVVRVRFWRVPAATLPADRGARLTWLLERWEEVDLEVARQRRLDCAESGPLRAGT